MKKKRQLKNYILIQNVRTKQERNRRAELLLSLSLFCIDEYGNKNTHIHKTP